MNETKMNETKSVIGTSLSKNKDGLCNAYYELLSEHASQIISPQSVPILATSHLVGCVEYFYKPSNTLETKLNRSAAATFYQVG